MLSVIKSFLAMDARQRCLYQVGRRTGLFHCLDALNNTRRMARVEKTCRKLGILPLKIQTGL